LLSLLFLSLFFAPFSFAHLAFLVLVFRAASCCLLVGPCAPFFYAQISAFSLRCSYSLFPSSCSFFLLFVFLRRQKPSDSKTILASFMLCCQWFIKPMNDRKKECFHAIKREIPPRGKTPKKNKKD